MSNIIFCVDNEVFSVDVVALHDLLKDFRLMHCTFFHEVNSLIVVVHTIFLEVVYLYADLISQLALLGHEVSDPLWYKLPPVFREKTDFIVAYPAPLGLIHHVHTHDSAVLSSSQ